MDAGSGLTVVSRKSFTNENVDIDGREFVDCTFDTCVLVYSGGRPFLFTRSPIAGCSIQFRGPAEATLNALKSSYAAGMGKWVGQIFQIIRAPGSSAPH